MRRHHSLEGAGARSRRLATVAALGVAVAAAGFTGGLPRGVLASGTCTTTTTSTYSVQVCITAPAAGATLTGVVPVQGTATVLSGSTSVQRMVFTLDGAYLLTDYSSPYSFSLPTARWVDGAHTLGVSALLRNGATTSSASEPVTFSNGVTTPPVNTGSPTITPGTDPAAGAPFVVAAVGDGAGGDATAQAVVNRIASWSPNLFLYLGDVYEKGSPTEFYNWYAPVFGTLRSVSDPVIGNHEYSTGSPAGYFDYWNNEPNWYSFDSHGWHFIALNSNSNAEFTSTQWNQEMSWLQSDLAAHPGACTIAYYHHPLYNIGPEGSTTRDQSIWSQLAAAHATLVLNGHDHTYQRWTALDANGNPSPTGVTEVVAGTGGHSGQTITGSDSRVVKSLSGTGAFGALDLGLTTTQAQLQFVLSGGTVADSTAIPCQGYGTVGGTVTDAATGVGIAGATVTAGGVSTTTGATGAYTLTHVPVGRQQVSASAPGFTTGSAVVTVGGGATVTQNLALSPSLSTGTIAGTVTDAGTAAAIAGATVSYSGGSTTTDSTGHYSLGGVAPGTYTVTASAAGYQSASQTVSVTGGSTTTQSFALTSSTGTVAGTVTDAVTAGPIAGATVSSSQGNATTDSQGRYSIPGVAPGSLTVTAAAAGYTSQSATVTVSAGMTTTQSFALSPQTSSAPIFTDGFESGTLSAWTSSTGLVVESTTVHSGSFAAEGSTTNGGTYARRTFSQAYGDLYDRVWFDVVSRGGTSTVNLLGDRTAGGSSLVRIYLDGSGRLALRNDVASTSVSSTATPSTGTWHELELHAVVNGTSSSTAVWLDGTAVPALTLTGINLGTGGVGQLQIGENQTGRTYDVVFDDVAAGTSWLS